jgi:molybdate transport system substrate-binding protein
MRRLGGALAALAAAILLLAQPARADAITVFAAASLKESLDEVARAFQAATGHHVAISYGGSNVLARQVERGAPADVFISADLDWMEYLEKKDLLSGPPRKLLGNALVLIAPASSTAQVKLAPGVNLAPLLAGKRIAMAHPDAVPAGRYAKAALVSLGAWSGIENSIAATASVRAALMLVARGEAPLGIVYRTDALVAKEVRIVDTFPAGSHPPIVYPMANIRRMSPPAAFDFSDFVASAPARAIFQRFGFATL